MTTPLSPSPAAHLVPSWTQFFLPGTDDDDAPGAPLRQKPQSTSEFAGEVLGDRAGTLFGEFELLHLLGRGGMGEVYEALYRADRQRYAIKILAREHRDNPTMVTRFEHEFWALRRCRHAGIVGALFAGVVDGERYYVMDLLRGESLENVLRRGRLASERVAQIGVQLSQALSALHAEGVLHRDLKPGNVLLLDDRGPDGGEQVRLIDLGIAKLLPRFYRDVELRTPPEKRLMTQAGARLGTPGYMAPEVGLGAAPSEAQDVFSLGVTLFRLATGRMPYSEVLPLALGDKPRWAKDLRCPIPKALETVLRRAVDMDPKVRQPSMTRLCEELETVAEELEAEKAEKAEDLQTPPAEAPREKAETAPVVMEASSARGTGAGLVGSMSELGLSVELDSDVEEIEAEKAEDLQIRSAEGPREEAETAPSVGEISSARGTGTAPEGSMREPDLCAELDNVAEEFGAAKGGDLQTPSAAGPREEAEAAPLVGRPSSARGTGAPLGGSTNEPGRGFSWPGRGFWIGLVLGVGLGVASLLALRPAASEGWVPARTSALRTAMLVPSNAPSVDATMLASAEDPPSGAAPGTSADRQPGASTSKPVAIGEAEMTDEPEVTDEPAVTDEPDQPETSAESTSKQSGEQASARAAVRTPRMIAKRWARDHDAAIQRCIGSLRTLGAVAITLHLNERGGVAEVTSPAALPSLVRRCLHESFAGLDLGPGRGDRTIRLSLSRGSAKQ